jgi:hypothetical protein
LAKSSPPAISFALLNVLRNVLHKRYHGMLPRW